MKMVDTKSAGADVPFRVRTNRTGRRTYSREYKLEMVNECSVPGASLAAVAMAHQINANLLRRWVVEHSARRLAARPGRDAKMLPVTVASTGRLKREAPAPSVPRRSRRSTPGTIEIEFDAARVRVRGSVEAEALRTILDMLATR